MNYCYQLIVTDTLMLLTSHIVVSKQPGWVISRFSGNW